VLIICKGVADKGNLVMAMSKAMKRIEFSEFMKNNQINGNKWSLDEARYF